jgi:DnaJ-class molecular chaperone
MNAPTTCPACAGTGVDPQASPPAPLEDFAQTAVCPACHGFGVVPERVEESERELS